jgi:hypothetical protein
MERSSNSASTRRISQQKGARSQEPGSRSERIHHRSITPLLLELLVFLGLLELLEMHDVFISHSSDDKRAADAACAVLEARGIKCWMAPRNIRPGSDWGESIITAIEQSRIMLLARINL